MDLNRTPARWRVTWQDGQLNWTEQPERLTRLTRDGIECLLPGAAQAEELAGRLIGAHRAGELGKVASTSLHSALLVDRRDGDRLLALADAMGTTELYWSLADGALSLSNSAAGFGRRELDPQSLFNYLFFHMVPAPRSIYRGVSRLQAGQRLQLRSGKPVIDHYWRPRFNESASQTPAHDELDRVLDGAVERAAGGGNRVGAFLSGGLDSSTVSGMLARHANPARTFSIGFDAEGYDEIGYARIASKAFGTEQHEYYVTPQDVIEMVPKIAAFYDEPFGNSSALPAYFCARMAREQGVDLLLAGDGGDELFAGNERYAKQAVFEIYQRLPGLLRHGLMEPVAGLLPRETFPFSKLRSYIEQASVTLPDRLNTYNYLRRHAASEIFARDFLSQIDEAEPLAIQQALYDAPQDASSLNRMLYHDWQITLADNDLRKVNKMCELAGMQVAYPMLDPAVVELSCRVPSRVKLPGNKLRDYYKQAFGGFLPQQIINKPKHGFGLPFGVWMTEHPQLQSLAYDALTELKKHNTFRADFIDRTIEMHRSVHAKFYGELVWVMMMLSLWLDSHQQ